MSFNGRTPESLLPRSDSKNPATTCKGITSNGRPCRRALAAALTSSPFQSPSRNNGVLAVLEKSNAAAFYCWQHKDQAETLAAQPEQRTSLYPLKERSSIDTLADRVGVLDLDEELPPPKKVHHRRKRRDESHLTRRDTLPSGWHDMQGPLMTVPEDIKQSQSFKRREYRYGRSNVKASWTCCIQADDDEPPPRPRPHRQQPHAQASAYTSPSPMTIPTPTTPPTITTPPSTEIRRKPISRQDPHSMQQSPPASLRPPAPRAPKSETQTLLSLIPTTLSPQITSALLAELSRPISPHDEAGYIYIFWLTPESEVSKPDDETASSLLDDDEDYQTSANRGMRARSHDDRKSRALNRYASVHHTPRQNDHSPKTILLKIGRAANVHRRLSQWTKQCGQNITLIRYYPYSTTTKTSHLSPHHQHPSSSSPPNQTQLAKVPYANKVERLIHLELSDKRPSKTVCETCGREHREWFEIDASTAGLRAVDRVIRRWVGWAENIDALPAVGNGSGRRKSDSAVARGSQGVGEGTDGMDMRDQRNRERGASESISRTEGYY